MFTAAQPDIALTICNDSEFYRAFRVGMDGFSFCTDQKRSSADSRYIMASNDGELAGFVKYVPSTQYGNLYVAYVEVRRDLHGKGISRPMLKALFDAASSNGDNLLLSPYTANGKQRLLPQIERLQKLYPHIGLYYEQC